MQSVTDSLLELQRSMAKLDSMSNQASDLYGKMQESAAIALREWDAGDTSGLEPLGDETVSDFQAGSQLQPFRLAGLTLFEDPCGICSRTASTGKWLWPAAIALVDVLERNLDILPARRFCALELGSGLGAVGLYIAKHRPDARVYLTDVVQAVPLLRYNVEANFSNGVPDNVLVRALFIGSTGLRDCAMLPKQDVVIAADMCYQAELVEMLLVTLSCLGAAVNLISVADRPGSRESFAAACSSHNFEFGRVWHFPSAQIGRRDVPMSMFDVFVYELFQVTFLNQLD